MKTRNINRLCIYFFYDIDGIVDDYVIHCLHELKTHVSKFIFVSNGSLTKESKDKLNKISSLVLLERENKGFDVWAYKTALEFLGWDKIETYDELIMMNFTIIGPVYPFSEMFETMDTKDPDFWGITVYHREKNDVTALFPSGYTPEHLQSHFIAVRQNMLRSSDFQSYWSQMREINSYQEAVAFHEATFTQRFAQLGFSWRSYIDTSEYKDTTTYALMFLPSEIILQKRCPIFKRKLFLRSIYDEIGISSNTTASGLIQTLKTLSFDTDLIFSHLLRVSNQYDIRTRLNAQKIIPRTSLFENQTAPEKIAVFAFLKSQVQYQLFLEYYQQISEIHSCYLFMLKNSNIIIEESQKSMTITVENESDIFLKSSDFSKEFGWVCYLGFADPPSISTKYEMTKLNWYRHSLDSLIPNEMFIQNFIQNSKNNPETELYLSFPANFAEYRTLFLSEWEDSFEAVKKLVHQSNPAVLVEEDKPPISSSFGGFWIKGKAFYELQSFLKNSLNHWDLTILYKSLPFLIQNRRKMAAYLLSESVAATEITLLSHELHASKQPWLYDPTFFESPNKHIGGLYFTTDGKYDSSNVQILHYKLDNENNFLVQTKLAEDAIELRFDPEEGLGFLCDNLKITVNQVEQISYLRNGYRYFDYRDAFISSDPQYIIRGNFKAGDHIVISAENVRTFSARNIIPVDNKIMSETDYGAAIKNFFGEIGYKYELEIEKQVLNQNELNAKHFISEEIVQKLTSELDLQKEAYSNIISSASWKITKPLRKLMDFLKR